MHGRCITSASKS
uniref:Uncharacterized protein n=1 Tax=Arundo donax TaxID=35708 RepID=A0A0A8Z5K6_ARUDO